MIINSVDKLLSMVYTEHPTPLHTQITDGYTVWESKWDEEGEK